MKWELDKDTGNIQWESGEWVKLNTESVAAIITNRELYNSPFGWGQTEAEAFARMLDSISEYRAKLDKVEAEIREILTENSEAKDEN